MEVMVTADMPISAGAMDMGFQAAMGTTVLLMAATTG